MNLERSHRAVRRVTTTWMGWSKTLLRIGCRDVVTSIDRRGMWVDGYEVCTRVLDNCAAHDLLAKHGNSYAFYDLHADGPRVAAAVRLAVMSDG